MSTLPRSQSHATASTSYATHNRVRHPAQRTQAARKPLPSCTPPRHKATVSAVASPVARSTQHPTPNTPAATPPRPALSFHTIPQALDAMAQGQIIVVLDDEDRENEGDLIMAADHATTQALHFFVEHTSGVVCVAMPGADLDRLRLPLMVDSRANDESMSTAFTITVDLRQGTTTGISASDRAATIAALANPATQPDDLRRPGHIFPLRARPGGVLTRPGHTEAAVDLALLAGRAPAGVLCEIVNRADGSMARTPELLAFARDHNLRCVTIDALVRHRLATEPLVSSVSAATAAAGPLHMQEFEAFDGAWHVLALWHAERQGVLHTLRHDVVHDVFGLCKDGLVAGGPREAAAAVAAHGGVVVYITSRGGLPEHLHKACKGAPGGPARALELAVARSVVRGLEWASGESTAASGHVEDVACMEWWDAQQHGAA